MSGARRTTRASGCASRTSAWTWAEVVERPRQRAAFFRAHAPVDAPFHVGVLLDNIPEFWFTLCGAALVRRDRRRDQPDPARAPSCARDIAHTDCAFVSDRGRGTCELFEARATRRPSAARGRRRRRGSRRSRRSRARRCPTTRSGADRPVHADLHVGDDGRAQGRADGSRPAGGVRRASSPEMFGLGPDDVCYSVMPLFHSNAAVAGFTNVARVGRDRQCCAGGSRRRGSCPTCAATASRSSTTSASRSRYILATPEQPDDADNPLRIAFGNEAAPLDIDRFATRFGCIVVDGYGSTEGGLNMSRTPETPEGFARAARVAPIRAEIRDPETGDRVPAGAVRRRRAARQRRGGDRRDREPRRRRAASRATTTTPKPTPSECATACTGPATSATATSRASSTSRAASGDWLRVDGENFAAAPVEHVLARHPDVVLAAVYAVPSADVGDEVMVALHLRDGADVRSRRVRRVPRRAAGPLTEVDAALRARHRAACRRPRPRRC